MTEAIPGTARSILVVDDNADIRSFMTDALERAEYDVRTAPEGAQALTLLHERPADLLITDLFMAGRDGFEMIEDCLARFPATRIIAMSAGGTRLRLNLLPSAALLGVDATLHKPFEVDKLLETVQKVLRAR
jgi:DNA-binding NtrC family response regulator